MVGPGSSAGVALGGLFPSATRESFGPVSNRRGLPNCAGQAEIYHMSFPTAMITRGLEMLLPVHLPKDAELIEVVNLEFALSEPE